MLPTLTELAQKYKTDKIYEDHSHFGKNFMNIYEKYFESIRLEPIHFLEIGVFNGASLRCWREYFPNAIIHGVDIMPSCKQYESPSENIFVHILDCSDEESLANFSKLFENYFDVILDDGSHINTITLKSFKHLYPCLKKESYYIIEDLGCCYIGSDLPEHLKYWPGTERILNKEYSNNIQDMFSFYSNMHAAIDWPKLQKDYHIEYMHHYTYIVIFRKNEYYKE